MARYELVEGSASKFWEVEVANEELTVRFGRIGTAGQTKAKSFADAAAATRERDKLVKEKTGKGYRLTDGDATVSAAVSGVTSAVPASPLASKPALPAQAAVAAPATPPPPLPAPAQPPIVENAAVVAVAGIAWPSGGFLWTDELRAQLPIVRGIHVPPFVLDPALPDQAPEIDEQNVAWLANQSTWRTDRLKEVAAAAGRTWTAWDTANLRSRTTRQALEQADFEGWLELCAQLCVHHRYGQWPVQAGLLQQGPAFMLEVLVSLQGNGAVSLPLLRHAIAAADADEYDKAETAAIALRERGDDTRLLCAFLFPHRADWAADCLAAGLDDRQAHLRGCVMPPDALIAWNNRHPQYFPDLKPALLLQVHLHGDRALPVFSAVFDSVVTRWGANKEIVADALSLIARMRLPELIPRLGVHIENLQARATLDKLSREFPAAVLLTAVQRAMATRSRTLEGWAVRLALREPAALAPVLAALEPAQRERFESMLASLATDEAPADRLPALLRQPPWLDKQRAQDLPLLELTPLPSPDRFDWTAEQLEAFQRYVPPDYVMHTVEHRHGSTHQDNDSKVLSAMYFNNEGIAAVLKGRPIEARHFRDESWYSAYPDALLLMQNHAAALHVWNGYPQAQFRSYDDMTGVTRLMLARHGAAALPGLLRQVQGNAIEGLPNCMPIDSLSLVPHVLHALCNLKKARALAVDWIRAHPRTTLIGAIPVAFGKDKVAAVNAQYALRWMADNGFADLLRAVADEHGAPVRAAVQAALDADPLRVLPARMPKLPGFFVPASLRRPELRDGGALPVAAIEHIGSMLAISKLDAPYPGLDAVRDICTPASLAEFAWDLFEAWIAAGAPSKENWAFNALGFFGNDETARRLAPKIREWPGESAHARAVTGLDLLALIGSDVALMHLNGIAGKVKFKALQDRAREKIAAVAESRGFTPDELADRLVPDLGLDDDGTLTLDFGPRHFKLAFDETLKPFVRDAQGVRLKDLPKPIKSDDETLASAAVERFKQMKKDAKAIASLQITRLEMGMVARRRWPAADFRLFFVEHPLLRHIAARVAWGVYADGVYTQGLRIAEDGTLADRDDSLFVLPEDASVGIAHVLEMPAEDIAAFGQVFADYEILQPFRQLGRETFTLTEAERASHETARFASKTVATGSVMGLVNRGWERGEAQDAGWVGEFIKPLPDGLEAVLQLDPGTIVGDLSYEPKQTLPTLGLRRRRSWDAKDQVTLDQLDPIIASELLRDVEMLAAMKD